MAVEILGFDCALAAGQKNDNDTKYNRNFFNAVNLGMVASKK